MICVYNQRDQLELSSEIQVNYFQLGNVALLERPQVSGQTMVDAGWTDAGDGTATVYSMSYSAGTDGIEWNHDVLIHITPIKQNGTVLTPGQLDSYVDSLLSGTTINSILESDHQGNNLVLWVQEVNAGWDRAYEFGDLFDDLLHRLQAVYYLHDYEEFPNETDLKRFNKSISIYPSFDGNGDVILTPTECKIKQVAGGQYDLTMKHPIDPWGKWGHLVPEAIIKAPIPEEKIESAVSGLAADVYVVSSSTATMYSGPHAPQRITYQQFYFSGVTYAVGDKVTYVNHNYQMHTLDPQTEMGYNHPPDNYPEYWKRIADYTSGDPVLVVLNQGDEVYLIEDVGSGWYQVSTVYGLTGYIQSSQLTYSHHLTPDQTQPKVIREQLFRIKTVGRDTKSNSVSVTAEHVSYDLKGILVAGVDISQKVPAEAIAWIRAGFMMEYTGTIATNMTSSDDGSYTGKINGKNAIYALLDPDAGIVAKFDAELRRDNWDLFIMRKTETDRGFRLRYRKNILGVNWNMKSDQLVTRVVPVARDEKGNDFFLDGTQWVDSDLISNYPVIRMEWLKVSGQVGKDDGTETGTNWTETTLRAEMEARAQARFDTDKADQVVNEITIDFEMLGDTEEYKALKPLEKVLMYDTVIATDERIGLDVSVTVTEWEWDAIREKMVALKLSNVSERVLRSVSGFSVVNRSITGAKLTDDAGDEIESEAVDRATEYAAEYTNSKTNALNNSLRYWVNQNFEPKAT